MNDNAPHKSRPLYSVWPIVVLMLFFGTAISLWRSENPVLAIIVGVVGIIIYWIWVKARTKMIREELTLRQLFNDWFHTS